MTKLRSATPQEIIEKGGATIYCFGMPVVEAPAAGYSIPPGPRMKTISDSRLGEAEAKRMGEIMDTICGNIRTRRVLSLFDGIGSTSYAIAKVLVGTRVTGIDRDHETHQRGKHNIQQACLIDRVTLIEADALSYLNTSGEFDAIFVDPWWPDRPEGYDNGTFSLKETNPPLTDIIPKALEHAPLVVARVPFITNIAEIIDMSKRFGKELFIDTYRIAILREIKTKAAFFADTGNSAVSTREAVFDPNQNVWKTTAYQR